MRARRRRGREPGRGHGCGTRHPSAGRSTLRSHRRRGAAARRRRLRRRGGLAARRARGRRAGAARARTPTRELGAEAFLAPGADRAAPLPTVLRVRHGPRTGRRAARLRRAGPGPGRDLRGAVAARRARSRVGGSDEVRDEFTWAALDCPTGAPVLLELPPDRAIVLGTMAASIVARPKVGLSVRRHELARGVHRYARSRLRGAARRAGRCARGRTRHLGVRRSATFRRGMTWHCRRRSRSSRAKVRNWGRWGDDDEIGTLNLITDDVVKARRRARSGRASGFSLGVAARRERSADRVHARAREPGARDDHDRRAAPR